jgi:hypothetical protein
MSYDFIVYARSERLPSSTQLLANIRRTHPTCEFDVSAPLTEPGGYFPLELKGEEVGFEMFVNPITERERARWHQALAAARSEQDKLSLEAVDSSDIDVVLSCQSEPSIAAARIFAIELARLSGGYFCDPQLDIIHRVP